MAKTLIKNPSVQMIWGLAAQTLGLALDVECWGAIWWNIFQMKVRILFTIGFWAVVSTYGQGQINFANTATTLLMTNGCGQIPGSGLTSTGYTIGLYTAPFGTKVDSLFTLIAVTPSLSGAALGRFDGGTITLPGIPPGTPFAFQIKAWQTGGGASYEAELGSGGYYFLGRSAVGFAVLSSVGQTPPSLMGDGYGQVPGITLFYAGPPYILGTPNYNNEFGCPYSPPITNVTIKITRSIEGAHTISWTNVTTPNVTTPFILEWAPTIPASNQWQAVITNVANTNGLLSYSLTNSDARFYRLRKW